jgi:3',5'-cyclic-AMP phosphodiesterase
MTGPIMTFKKIITLTDIHIMPGNQLLIGIDPKERLALAVDHINRTQSDADLLIITGDLTHYGDPESYVTLRNILAGLTIPVKILVGNHDIRENFIKAFPEAETDENGFVQFATRLGGFKLIGLDTMNAPHIEGTRKGAGYLGEQRLPFLADALANDPQVPSILFMHHPAFKVGFPGMDAIPLMDPDAFYHVIKDHNVRMIVFGHIHRSISVSWRGINATGYRSLVDQMPFDLVTVDSSLAVDEPPSYGVILLGDDLVLAHSVEFMTEPGIPGAIGSLLA